MVTVHILVTNDDGVTAPGLLALAQAMRPFGKVTVLAPDHNWSVSGHVKTLHRPLRVKEVHLADGSPALATDGAPSDCVAMAALGVLNETVDLVVSGINPYANLGHDLTYSGTVTAAMEGCVWGIPSIAFSLDGKENGREPDYQPAVEIAHQVATQVIKNGLPEYTLLSVNIPALPADEIRGYRITRQGLRIYRDELVRYSDPRGRPFYWIGGEAPTGVPDDGTDIGELSKGYVAITPVELDMTAHHLISQLGRWPWPNDRQGTENSPR